MITVVVPAGLQVISNGALLGGPEPAGPGVERWRWQETEPMATYLAFVAIGHYDIVRRDTRFGLYLAAYAQGTRPGRSRMRHGPRWNRRRRSSSFSPGSSALTRFASSAGWCRTPPP